MNKIIIANYRETEPQVISREGNSFAVKPVIREADAEKCAASFVEVGDAIAFPASPEGAHVIRNGSATEKLVYLDVGTRLTPDVVHFPDTASGMVYSSSGVHHFRES